MSCFNCVVISNGNISELTIPLAVFHVVKVPFLCSYKLQHITKQKTKPKTKHKTPMLIRPELYLVFAISFSVCCAGIMVCIHLCIVTMIRFMNWSPQVTPLDNDEESPDLPVVELHEKTDYPIAEIAYTPSVVVIANVV